MIHYNRLQKKCTCINVGKTNKPRNHIFIKVKKAIVVLVGGGVSICCHGSEVYCSF